MKINKYFRINKMITCALSFSHIYSNLKMKPKKKNLLSSSNNQAPDQNREHGKSNEREKYDTDCLK